MISPYQLSEMQARLNHNVLRDPPAPEDAVEDEPALHSEILSWCKSQVPIVPHVHSRTDKRSRTTVGCADFIIFLKQKVYVIECKTRTGKRTPAQLAWALLVEMQGFKVEIVRSLSEFLAVVA